MDLRDQTHARNLKDFLLLYNKLTEECFQNCVSNFTYHNLRSHEMSCVDICTDRYVSFNQRFMKVFLEAQDRRQSGGTASSPVIPAPPSATVANAS